MKTALLTTTLLIAASAMLGQSTTPEASTAEPTSAVLQTLLTSATPFAALHIAAAVTPPNGKAGYNTDIYVQPNGQWRKVQHQAAGDRTDDTTSGERAITEPDGSKFTTSTPRFGLLNLFPAQVLQAQLNASSFFNNIQYVDTEQLFGRTVLHFRVGEKQFVSQSKQNPELPRIDGDADVFVDQSGQAIVAVEFATRPIPLVSAIPKNCLDSSSRIIKSKDGHLNTACIMAAHTPMVETLVHFGDFRSSPMGLLPYSIDVSVPGIVTHYTVNTVEVSAQ